MPDLIGKFLPENVKKALADKEVSRDLAIILGEMGKISTAAAQQPNTDKRLQESFKDASFLLSTFTDYVQTRNLPFKTMFTLTGNLARYKGSADVIAAAFDAQNNPVMESVKADIEANQNISDAFKRVMIKTDGQLIDLREHGGQYYGVELITGSELRIAMTKEDYEENLKLLADARAKKQGPQGPKGPGYGA